LDLPTGRQAQ